MLTGLLDRSSLFVMLTEIEALGLDLFEVGQLHRNTNHQNPVTAAHRDSR